MSEKIGGNFVGGGQSCDEENYIYLRRNMKKEERFIQMARDDYHVKLALEYELERLWQGQ